MIRWLPLIFVVLLTGCATQMAKMEIPIIDAPGSKQPLYTKVTPGKFEPSLMAIGSEKDLAQERGRHMGFVKNESLVTWLTGIRDKLLRASAVDEVPGSIQIVANTAYSARATADGNILVSMAWLPDVESEDEIAAIIAHELSHVLLKHQSANFVGLVQKRFQTAHQLLLGGRMSLNKATQLGVVDRRTLLAAQLSVDLVDKLVMPAWNRRQETEADLLGIDLLIRAGYAPEGMTRMLERLRTWEKANEAAERTRMENLKSLASQDAKANVQNPLKTLLGDLSREHPETDSRLEAIAEYQELHYGDHHPPELTVRSLQKLRSARNVAPVLKNYQHAIRAKKRLADGDTAAAYKEAQQGVQQPTARDTMPNWILWQTAKAVGRQQQHQKSLEIALKSSEPIVEVFREAIRVNEDSGKHQIALNLVDEASEAFGDAPEWVPDRIRLLKKLGKKEEAQLLALRCTVETPELKQRCLDEGTQ